MLNPEIKKLLLAASPFRYLQPQELETLIAHSKILSFKNQETLIQQGKISHGMYIIIEGKALVIVKALGKNAMTFATLEEGNFIGETSLIEKIPATASVVAEGPLQCIQITTTYFDMLSSFFPETKYKITKAITEEICDRLIQLHQKISVLMNHSNMTQISLLSEIIKTFTHPEPISYEDAHIGYNQLRHLPFFELFSTEEYDQLLAMAKLVQAKKNCTLIKEGERDAPYFVVLWGAAQASIIQHNKIAKIMVLGPMSFFGSPSYVNGSPSIITYSSFERVTLLKISTENLIFLQKNNIQLWYKIIDLICRSFVTLDRSMAKLYVRLNNELYNR